MPACVKLYHCSACDFTSKTKRTMHEHYIKLHKYKCHHCNTVLSSRKELKEHNISPTKVPFKMHDNPFLIVKKILFILYCLSVY